MNEMKIGKYTVTGRIAEGVTEEEKKNRLVLLVDAISHELELQEQKAVKI